ncbi:MAG: fused MFS/spermidine synthase [Thermodesulfovibrionales bacterium]|nr:fused MFS/spermidine synthase [Thermodesulfovibrionales bacterium]
MEITNHSHISDSTKKSLIKYYILCFIYGGLLMYFEITAAKMIIPFYGASLKVWATVLCGVLSGLSIGYFIGGRVNLNDFASKSSFIAGLLIFTLPFVSPLLFKALYPFGHNIGLILSGVIICVIPSVFFGILSPNLVNVLCRKYDETGNITGIIFAVSTVGGVLMAILSGFWFIPVFGVSVSCFLIGILLLLVSLVFSLFSGSNKMIKLTIPFLLLTITISVFFSGMKKQPDFIKYKNVGFYGELIVADLLHKKDGRELNIRVLLNNRIAQSFINLQTGLSEWRYIQYLDLLSSMKPEGSKALMLGLAGGSLANEMIEMGFEVDAVDIDYRVHEIALKYFKLNPKCNFFVDDARHFINSVKTRYDIVIIDLFSAESQPFHIFTLESFKRIKEILNKDGLVLINFHESVLGDKGRGLRAVYKTMTNAGFVMNYLNTSETLVEDRNNILIGSMRDINWEKVNYSKKTVYQQRGVNLPIRIKTLTKEMLTNDYILTDDKPVFEVINEEAFRDWRGHAIDNYLLGLAKMGMPLF